MAAQELAVTSRAVAFGFSGFVLRLAIGGAPSFRGIAQWRGGIPTGILGKGRYMKDLAWRIREDGGANVAYKKKQLRRDSSENRTFLFFILLLIAEEFNYILS
ncbi:hypothetical protein QOT17_010980 [Balamuthia mandrillaris]